jgi:DNA-binding MurR/RpiR family transcriptional regulator
MKDRSAAAAEPRRPSTIDALRARIAALGNTLTPRGRAAARYAIEHPNDIALLAVAAVAERSGIAASAYIRMAQALGFSGYGELQGLFLAPLQQGVAPTYRERIRHYGGELAIDDPSDPVQVLGAFAQANIVSLEHLRDDAPKLALPRAIGLLRGARMVYVLGLRRSYAVAAYLAYALNRVGRPCVQITGLGGAIAEQASPAGPRDLLVAISFPPYAGDTVAVCDQVRIAGARRLAITDTVLSPVARDADLVLQVNDAELLGFRSLTSAMALAQTLAMGIAFRDRRGTATADAGALEDIDC